MISMVQILSQTIGAAPADTFSDAVARDLMRVLWDFERRLAALECPTCRQLDTSCREEHEEASR